MAFLRALNHAWHGYAAILLLQPNISRGTILKTDSDFAGAPTELADSSGAAGGPKLAKGTSVKVFGYYPRLKGRTLYVRVLDGGLRGAKGWVDIETIAGAVLGYYGCCSY
jgi:hypothetical protein